MASMTRQHFAGIARALLAERPERDGSPRADGARDEWSTIVLRMADLCAGSNPAFDRARFLAAAGME